MPFKMPNPKKDSPIEGSGIAREMAGVLIKYARKENLSVGAAYDKLLKYCQDKQAKDQ